MCNWKVQTVDSEAGGEGHEGLHVGQDAHGEVWNRGGVRGARTMKTL